MFWNRAIEESFCYSPIFIIDGTYLMDTDLYKDVDVSSIISEDKKRETAEDVKKIQRLSIFDEYEPAFSLSMVLKAPVINTEASDFMVENIHEIKNNLLKMSVDPDHIDDLYNDVYISIKQAELDGNGYDETADTNVRQFVYGRLKGYSKNKAYSSKYVECRSGCVLVAASSDSDDEDNLSGFQAAYKNASSIDEMDLIDLELSVKSAIKDCIRYCSKTDIKITDVFRNVEQINAATSTNRKMQYGNSVFADLQKINATNPDFMEAMVTALTYRTQNIDRFLEILDLVEKETA